MTGRAKWDSWKATSTKYAGKEADAQERYISIASECAWVQGETVNKVAQEEEPSAEELLSRDTPERTSDTGTGAVVSTVSAEDQSIDEQSLHGLAILGDPTKLRQFMKDNRNADLNAVDEYVGDRTLRTCAINSFSFEGLYTSSPCLRSRTRGNCQSAPGTRRRHFNKGVPSIIFLSWMVLCENTGPRRPNS